MGNWQLRLLDMPSSLQCRQHTILWLMDWQCRPAMAQECMLQKKPLLHTPHSSSSSASSACLLPPQHQALLLARRPAVTATKCHQLARTAHPAVHRRQTGVAQAQQSPSKHHQPAEVSTTGTWTHHQGVMPRAKHAVVGALSAALDGVLRGHMQLRKTGAARRTQHDRLSWRPQWQLPNKQGGLHQTAMVLGSSVAWQQAASFQRQLAHQQRWDPQQHLMLKGGVLLLAVLFSKLQQTAAGAAAGQAAADNIVMCALHCLGIKCRAT